MSADNNRPKRRTTRKAARAAAGTHPDHGRGRVVLQFTAPGRPSVSGSGAVVGSSLLAAGLAGGHLPPEPALVWPLVALSIAAMAYDLGRKALRRGER